MRTVVLSLVAAAALPAAEEAVFTSGFRMRVDRHEMVGEIVRLYAGTGVTEVSRDSIVRFEAEPAPVSPPAAERKEPAMPQPVPAPAPAPRELVRQAALEHGLPPDFVQLVAAAESGFEPAARSVKGAIGVMQLMPATAGDLGVDPYVPAENARGGAKYLRELLIKYKDYPDQLSRSLAAYNAGPGAVDRYNGVPPYPETQRYVQRVIDRYLKARRQ